MCRQDADSFRFFTLNAVQVRNIGVSNESSYGVMKFIQAAESAGLPRICSIQNSYSLLVRGPFETDLAEVRWEGLMRARARVCVYSVCTQKARAHHSSRYAFTQGGTPQTPSSRSCELGCRLRAALDDEDGLKGLAASGTI